MAAEDYSNNMQRDKNNKILQDTSIYGNLNKDIGRYGEASGQYIRGYTGNVAADGTVRQIGLKHVHQYAGKSYANKKSHAGFAAEIDEVSKTNAENIIADKNIRIARSNDVGRGNDMVYDIVYTDSCNRVIINKNGKEKGYQIKIKGRYYGDSRIKGSEANAENITKSYNNVINDLINKKNERYLDAGVAIGSEQYDSFKELLSNKQKDLQKSAKYLRQKGEIEKAEEKEEMALRAKKLSQKLRKAKDTSKEAMFSYEHPILATTKNVIKTSHKAGMEHAKATGIATSVSVGINSIVAVAKGEMDSAQALKTVALSTAKSMGEAYLVGNADVILKGFMENSSNKAIQAVSKSNLPGKLMMVTKQLSGSLRRLVNGEIDEKEFLQELGSQEAGMLAAGWGSALGAAGAAAVSDSLLLGAVGAAAGSTIGLLVFSSLYEGAMQIYAEEKESEERRKLVESIAKEARERIKIYREELEQSIKQFYGDREKAFLEGFQLLNEGFNGNNVDTFVEGLSKIAIEMGSCLQFKDFNEFDDFMQDNTLSLEF